MEKRQLKKIIAFNLYMLVIWALGITLIFYITNKLTLSDQSWFYTILIGLMLLTCIHLLVKIKYKDDLIYGKKIDIKYHLRSSKTKYYFLLGASVLVIDVANHYDFSFGGFSFKFVDFSDFFQMSLIYLLGLLIAIIYTLIKTKQLFKRGIFGQAIYNSTNEKFSIDGREVKISSEKLSEIPKDKRFEVFYDPKRPTHFF